MEGLWMYMWATERFRRTGEQLPAWALLSAIVAGVALAIWLVKGPEWTDWIDAWQARRAEKRRASEPPYPSGPAGERYESPCETSCQSACQSSRQDECQGTCEMICQASCEATKQTAGTGPPEPKPKPKTESRTQELARTFGVHQLLLFTGDGAGSCSMACTYCFLHKVGPHRVMSEQTLRDAIAFLEGLTDEPSLHFFGTEPTMEWRLIVEARRLRPDWPMSMTTNGLLLTPERIDWITENDVRVYVYSIDGGPEHHRHRRDAQGRPTWERVSENLRYLVKAQGDLVTARVTWTPSDYDLVGRFRALEALGARSIQVVPDIELGVEWDEQRVEQAYLELGEHYKWRLTPSRFVNSMVDSIASDKPKPGYPCNAGHGYWTVMPDGELRTCQRGERIGSIYEGITDTAPLYESELCAQIVNSRQPLKPECSDCVAFGQCPGVGYCSAANRGCGNSAVPTEAHCQHLRGMVRACTVWAQRRPTGPGTIIQCGVLGVIYDAAS